MQCNKKKVRSGQVRKTGNSLKPNAKKAAIIA